jgi:probable HAF family extracellular repeat protein
MEQRQITAGLERRLHHPLLDTDPDYPRLYSSGNGINNSRQVVGSTDNGLNEGDEGVFLYDNGTAQFLGTAGGETALSAAINDNGQFVGTSQIDPYLIDFHAFRSDGGRPLLDLVTLGGTHSGASDINNSGQIVGSSDLATDADFNDPIHAFLYDGGTMNDLGTLGGTRSAARGINNSGQIVGRSNTATADADHAFLIDGGAMQDLCVLVDCVNAGWDSLSVASAINDVGDITGTGVFNGQVHAFLLEGGTLQDLGALEGGFFSPHVSDINNSGQVVGGGAYAFLYDGSTMQDLCVLVDCVNAGWDSLSVASAINDIGDITGSGVFNGQAHAFLVSTVPVPSAVWLFGSGLIGLIGVSRRKKVA